MRHIIVEFNFSDLSTSNVKKNVKQRKRCVLSSGRVHGTRPGKGPLTQAIFVAQLNAMFVALKLQPAAISSRF